MRSARSTGSEFRSEESTRKQLELVALTPLAQHLANLLILYTAGTSVCNFGHRVDTLVIAGVLDSSESCRFNRTKRSTKVGGVVYMLAITVNNSALTTLSYSKYKVLINCIRMVLLRVLLFVAKTMMRTETLLKAVVRVKQPLEWFNEVFFWSL